MKNTETDDQGDIVFRFHLPNSPDMTDYTLEEHYRRAILDMLRIVRLYHRGRPLLVDGFAFQNQLDRPVPLMRRDEAATIDAAG